jgi:hypothetical protein
MTTYFTTGTKDDEWVYLEARREPDGPLVVGIDLTPDGAESIGRGLVNAAQCLRAKKNK